MKKNPLELYNKKRNFKVTSEPEGKVAKSSNSLQFVVQEHHASSLHYDFRLEWEGVLKSWAVPKGPSMDPYDKRLASKTEDHPLAYASFEGSIPQGEYGGGEMSIWDSGTWEPLVDIKEGLSKGRLEFVLKGSKLKGKFYLVKTQFRGSKASNTWLLMKAHDEDAHISKPKSKKVSKSKKVTTNKTTKLTSIDKILFKKEKLTKLDVAKYYKTMASAMLPYLVDRPLSMVRCPRGTEDKCFFQKHLSHLSKGMKAFHIEDNNPNTIDEYIALSNAHGLQELVQINSFELHAWNCKYEDILHPDQIVMDFDPDPSVSWNEVIEAALELKEMLDEMKLKSFVKLTGGKGIHVHIPIAPKYSWDEVKEFSRNLADRLVENDPEKYIAQASKKDRKNKIFVDYLRNAYGSTAVAPYSLRAKAESSVAMPLTWSELAEISGPRVSLKEALKMLKERKKDPWAGMRSLKQTLPLPKKTKTHRLHHEVAQKTSDDEIT